MKERPDHFKLIEFIYMKPVKVGNSKVNIYGETFGKTIPQLEMLDINMTMLEIKKMMYEKVRRIFKDDHPVHGSEAELNKCIVLHVYNNIPYIPNGKYAKRKATCEFCKNSHGVADTCDLKIGQISANSIEGCEQIRLKDVLQLLEHNRDLIIGVILKNSSDSSALQMKLLEPEFD